MSSAGVLCLWDLRRVTKDPLKELRGWHEQSASSEGCVGPRPMFTKSHEWNFGVFMPIYETLVFAIVLPLLGRRGGFATLF